MEEEVVPEELPESEGPSLKVGMGVRTGVTLGLDDDTTLRLYDGLVDEINIRPYLSGTLNEYVSAVANFEIGTANGLGHFAILDAIIQVKLAEEFQIWLGQHIPASDRQNINGPFYVNSWNFPLTVPTFPFDVGARDRGVTFWGLIAGGHLKYHASIVDLQPGQKIENARYAGRVTVHLLEPEAFYYNSGTNYGAADMLAFGAVVHYQKGFEPEEGMELDNDFVGFSLDAIFEKNLGDSGTFTVEGAYYNFEGTGLEYAPNQGTVDEGTGVLGGGKGSALLGALSWLAPNKTGIGQLQPNARVQWGKYPNAADPDMDDETVTIDIGLGYVVDAFNHRWHLNYRHQELPGDASSDAIQIGAQVQL